MCDNIKEKLELLFWIRPKRRPRFIGPIKFIKTRHSDCLRSWLLGPPAMTTSNKLVKLLEDIMDDIRILIFMDTKKGCDQITRQLRMNGWSALSIHGDKSQVERDWVLSKFKANDCNRCCCSWSSMLGYFKEIDSPPPSRGYPDEELSGQEKRELPKRMELKIGLLETGNCIAIFI
ncbi:unnamed protein product [Prunus armeniaca]